MARRSEQPYLNHSALPPEKAPRERVPAPRPVFSSAEEVRAFQGAVAMTERHEGESLVDWIARVAARAQEDLT